MRSALLSLPPASAVVHVRAKDLDGGALLALARSVGGICRAAGQLFVVNDRLDVALASGADGVHLPVAAVAPADARRLLGAALVGVSCHSADEVRRARDGGADYATFGPVFDTPSKRAYGPPVGVAALAGAASLGLPLVGLGGVGVENAAAVMAAGAHGIAAIRAWLDTPDPGPAAAALLAAATPLDGRRRDHQVAPCGMTRTSSMAHDHGHHGKHGNPEDLDAYIARMEGEDRAAWQRPDDVVAMLQLRPGDTVADVGAGPGYFTVRLARAVGPLGRVFAVEVVPEMVGALRQRLDRARLGNVTVVTARDDDPLLPPASCDAVLVVNTFHHFPDGAAYLRRLAASLRPGGRILDVDFQRRELPVGPPVESKIARDDFLAIADRAGLKVAGERTDLPYQYAVLLRPRSG